MQHNITTQQTTCKQTLRDLSARASNPNVSQQSRETAQKTLRTMRERFNDDSVLDVIEYETLPMGWALPRDADGNQCDDCYSIRAMSADD